MPRLARSIALALPLVVAGVAACPSLEQFLCEVDNDCDREDGGVCVTADCAYPASDCDSGLRFSPNARRPGECVEPNGGQTSVADASTGGSDGSGTSTGTDGTATMSGGETGAQCGRQIPLTIDTMGLSGSVVLNDYPLLVDVQSTELAGIEPDSLWVTDSDGAALPFEVDTFDSDAGRLLAWVRLPAYEAGQALSLAVRYGDASGAPSYDPSQAWSDAFLAVWHLSEPLSGTQLDVSDSTAIGNRLTTRGEMEIVDQTAPIGGGFGFDGIDDHLTSDLNGDGASTPQESSFVRELGSFSATIWARVDDDVQHGCLFWRLNGHDFYPRCRRLPTSGALLCQIRVADDTVAVTGGADVFPLQQWLFIAVTYDKDEGTGRAYINGQEIAAVSVAAPGDQFDQEEPPDLPMEVGRIEPTSFGYLVGALDEFRVHARRLEPEWIRADFVSQSDNASVVSAGAPQDAPCP